MDRLASQEWESLLLAYEVPKNSSGAIASHPNQAFYWTIAGSKKQPNDANRLRHNIRFGSVNQVR
jgi:hypothetical protein